MNISITRDRLAKSSQVLKADSKNKSRSDRNLSFESRLKSTRQRSR